MSSHQELVDDVAAQEILRLAGEASQQMDSFSRENLVRAAAELDIDESWITEAITIVRDRQSEIDDREEFRRAQLKQTWFHLLLAVPVIIVFVLCHTVSIVAQAMSSFNGGIKGVTALFFAKSTGSELDFQEWRNKRFYKVEYGADDAPSMIAFYMRGKKTAEFDGVADFLTETNAIGVFDALYAIENYSNMHPKRILNRVASVKYPRTRSLSIWTTDLRDLFKTSGKKADSYASGANSEG